MIKSSGLKAASAIIRTGHCKLRGVSYTGDTLKFATLTVYDYLSAGGTIVALLRPVSSTTDVSNPTLFQWFGEGIDCETGLYAALSIAEGDYIVYYEIL